MKRSELYKRGIESYPDLYDEYATLDEIAAEERSDFEVNYEDSSKS